MSVPSTTWFFTEMHRQNSHWQSSSSTIIVRVGYVSYAKRHYATSSRSSPTRFTTAYEISGAGPFTARGSIGCTWPSAYARRTRWFFLTSQHMGRRSIDDRSSGETNGTTRVRRVLTRVERDNLLEPFGATDGSARGMPEGARRDGRSTEWSHTMGSATTIEVGYEDDAMRKFVRTSKPLSNVAAGPRT